ncbi:hypothetical protein BDR06DRAFT_41103 [Suillus hirtellus]|nr:hypothetical protein BDR06DRAFT_41103 [Suillus hirtellus]
MGRTSVPSMLVRLSLMLLLLLPRLEFQWPFCWLIGGGLHGFCQLDKLISMCMRKPGRSIKLLFSVQRISRSQLEGYQESEQSWLLPDRRHQVRMKVCTIPRIFSLMQGRCQR